MEDTRNEYRNPMKQLFKRYGIHRAIRSYMLNDLIDEINTYYKEKETSTDKTVKKLEEFHEQHLKEQLSGWIKYLEIQKLKLNSYGERNQSIIEGFCIVIQLLKDVAER